MEEKKEIWSVFKTEHFELVGKETSNWVKRKVLFMGDLSYIDTNTDLRFCEIKDKRKQSIFLGLVLNPEFPLKEPLKLI